MPTAASRFRARASPPATQLRPQCRAWSANFAVPIPADCGPQVQRNRRVSRITSRHYPGRARLIGYYFAVSKKDQPVCVFLSQVSLMSHQHTTFRPFHFSKTQREFYILKYGHRWDEVERLEDHSNRVAAVFRKLLA